MYFMELSIYELEKQFFFFWNLQDYFGLNLDVHFYTLSSNNSSLVLTPCSNASDGIVFLPSNTSL